jgi:KipI family sensor histidine kinase inhibitor
MSERISLYQSPSLIHLNAFTTLHWVNENSCLLEVDTAKIEQLFGDQEAFSGDQVLLCANKLIEQWVTALLDISSCLDIPETQDVDAAQGPSWLLNYVPSYTSLLLVHDLNIIDSFGLVAFLKKCAKNRSIEAHDDVKSGVNSTTHEIEVCYDPNLQSYLQEQALINETLPNDLPALEKHSDLPRDELIELHARREYRVFSVGFLPNFAYMGLTDEKLFIPRLSSPRKKVPAGAVAIADNQTAIYPQASPGGWHIIGYTYVDLSNQDCVSFKAGDLVRFTPISSEEYGKNLHTSQRGQKA